MIPHHDINLFWSDEDDCWLADVPDLRFCTAHGDMPEEAVAEVRLAMDNWLAVAEKRGLEPPAARYRPAPPEALAA